MAAKSDFTDQEWSKLLSAPTLAAMAVTLAEPSGIWGMLKEGMASARAVATAATATGGDALVHEIATSLTSSDGRHAALEAMKAELKGKAPAEMKLHVMERLAEVGALLDAKAAPDAPAAKAWLAKIAEMAAEASSEGGFLGFGGVKVSDAEKATIAELRLALKLA